ncbi:Ethanolamine utilization protein EutN [Poriferisphaera corsica]|uniref:Ethanolamine utilization protein EutN n=1 Tax=Poriferisphaera corsica TaxID=2528020 RepID=A0A517YUL7_9BACT|nr:EutN/CcmL family microcompartment protein [Poriferisphaera corsica]QDU33905.1 Ethanolamine utilization protein EutN [Poriferisphaera corsica]
MQLARITGRATSTVKHESFHGQKLLIADILNNKNQPVGDPVLILDYLGAGRGDTVIISSDGLGLRQVLHDKHSPARWWTIGIVD